MDSQLNENEFVTGINLLNVEYPSLTPQQGNNSLRHPDSIVECFRSKTPIMEGFGSNVKMFVILGLLNGAGRMNFLSKI